MLKKLLGVVILALVSGQVFAESGYFGASYSRVDFDGVAPAALGIKVGGFANEFFAFEGRIGLPLIDDSETFFGTEIDYETKYMGFLARIGNSGGDAAGYMLIGIMDVTLKGSAGNFSAEVSDSDMVFGFGLEAGEKQGFMFEYIVGTGDLEDISWFNLGFFNRF